MSKYTEKRDKAYFAQKQKEYRERNREMTRIKCQEYYKNNRETLINKRVEGRKLKLQTDPVYLFKIKFYGCFRNRLKAKNGDVLDLVGCSKEFLLLHLESTARQRYGTNGYRKRKYEIDHIIPLETAKTEDEVKALWHWTNLQYLKPRDNRSKGGRYKGKEDGIFV